MWGLRKIKWLTSMFSYYYMFIQCSESAVWFLRTHVDIFKCFSWTMIKDGKNMSCCLKLSWKPSTSYTFQKYQYKKSNTNIKIQDLYFLILDKDILHENITYYHIRTDHFMPEELTSIKDLIGQGIKDKVVHPLDFSYYKHTEIQKAFQQIQDPNNLKSVLIQVRYLWKRFLITSVNTCRLLL